MKEGKNGTYKMAVAQRNSQRKRKVSQKPRPAINKQALKKLRLVVVAYSNLERELFPTDEAYEAEREVEERAAQVLEEIIKLGIPARSYPADRYFLTNLLVDKPDLIVNLVDTVRGRDALQTSIPASLELAEIPYTGAGMRGMVIGNDRNLFKQLLDANDIPTPDFQFVSRRGIKLREGLEPPFIVKLNESGGSVGIDDNAVKETVEEALARADELIGEYRIPVIIERFVDGPEITVVVFDDGQRKHVFQAQKVFAFKPDGKHEFTSLESYRVSTSYYYQKVADLALVSKIEELTRKAFTVLSNRDYAKFDVRVDSATGTPYFTDCNPNTAFGPHPGLPFTEVLELHKVKFETVLASLISKHAKKIAA